MGNIRNRSWLLPALALALLGWRWVAPVVLPFLLGTLVALAAEPLVSAMGRLGVGRKAASGLGVTAVLLALLGLLIVLTAAFLRRLTGLTDRLPQLLSSAHAGLDELEGMLTDLSDRAPANLRPMLHRTVDSVFSSGSTLVEGLLSRLPAAASAVISAITSSALAVGTGCLAAYMLSARLPRLRRLLEEQPPQSPVGQLLPRLRRIRSALWGWLKAQGILCGLCFLLLSAGFLLMGIPWAVALGALIALVDAVPLLGTGTALVPWALVCFLQGNGSRAVGLLVLFGLAALCRSTLEPRLVGKQLGLDPLLTLAALYAGFQLWGFGGMLLAPVLCVVGKEALAGGGDNALSQEPI